MKTIDRIEVDFKIRKTKIITKVKLPNIADPIDLILDTGATMTTISPELFNRLNTELKDKSPIKIIGINSIENSYSTLIPAFTVGGTNLGEVRIAVGTMRDEFQNKVILGMNILGWSNVNISMNRKIITLTPRFAGNPQHLHNFFRYKNPDVNLITNEVE